MSLTTGLGLRAAHSCPSAIRQHAAARPFEPAIRCKREILQAANPHCADIMEPQCGLFTKMI